MQKQKLFCESQNYPLCLHKVRLKMWGWYCKLSKP